MLFAGWRLAALRATLAAAGGSATGCRPYTAPPGDSFADATTSQCPGLFTVLVVPSRASVGGCVAVTATAPAEIEGGPTTFAWSATTGTFADASLPVTTFTCTVEGTAMLSLMINQERCSEWLGASVDCLAAGSGGDDGSCAAVGASE
jgi:hypothetical protein